QCRAARERFEHAWWSGQVGRTNFSRAVARGGTGVPDFSADDPSGQGGVAQERTARCDLSAMGSRTAHAGDYGVKEAGQPRDRALCHRTRMDDSFQAEGDEEVS